MGNRRKWKGDSQLVVKKQQYTDGKRNISSNALVQWDNSDHMSDNNSFQQSIGGDGNMTASVFAVSDCSGRPATER